MAAKYATLKNAELEALLKERSLPHTGKKADMVARLEEDDKKKNEDEIDWDDDAGDGPAPSADKPTEPTPASDSTLTDSKVDGNNPQAVPNQQSAIDPSNTTDLAVKEPDATADTAANGEAPVPAAEEAAKEKEKTPVDYSIGIASTDLDKELAARKKRAERFGLKVEELDAAAVEAQKRLERAKKFGEVPSGGAGETGRLDSALTERRKRGREGGEDGRDQLKRRGGPGRGRGRRGERRGEARGETRGETRGEWMSKEDRARAEARKARFT